MKPNIKTVPNQKVVKVDKAPTDGKTPENYYAAVNLNALKDAAVDLKPGAFKLWMYFSMNQNGYEFALSSADVAETFGIKRDMYNTAIKELTDKGYLELKKGNLYIFHEIPVVVKTYNETSSTSVVVKTNNDVVGKNHNVLQENTTTSCREIPQEILQDTTTNTLDITADEQIPEVEEVETADGTVQKPIVVSREWLIERHNIAYKCANGLFKIGDKFYKMEV